MPEIVEDIGLALRIHDMEAAALYQHILDRVQETRKLVEKIDLDSVHLLVAEEMLFLIGLRSSQMISHEQFQSLSDLLHGKVAA